MKPFAQTFLAVLAAGVVVAGGYFLLQRHTARSDRERYGDAVKLAAARDAIADWSVRLESSAADLERESGFGSVAPFLEAYKNVKGWLPSLPQQDRAAYEKILVASRDRALAALRSGGPEWQQIQDATR